MRTIDALARLFRVHRRTISEWRAQGLPGKRGEYQLPEVVEWVRLNKPLCDAVPTTIKDPEDEAQLTDSDSPWAEEYRKWKAKSARLAYLEKRGELVSVEKIAEGLQLYIAVLRSGLERLQRECGEEPMSIMDDSLTEAETELERHFRDRAASSDDDEQPTS